MRAMCRRFRFNSWVGKIPWKWKWQPTPAFLPGESHGRRGLVGYSPWGQKELDTTGHTRIQLPFLCWWWLWEYLRSALLATLKDKTVFLTIVTILNIRSPELVHLIVGSLYPLNNISSFPVPGSHHSTLYFCEFGLFLDPHISEIIQCLSFSDLFHLA